MRKRPHPDARGGQAGLPSKSQTMVHAGCESEHLPPFQPASPSRPSPQGGHRRGSHRLRVYVTFPIAIRRGVQAPRSSAVAVVGALVLRRMAVVADAFAIIPARHVARHGWRWRAVTAGPAIRVDATVARNAHVARAVRIRRSVTRTGLAARTVAIARTTCQSPGRWGQGLTFSPRSWGHPIARVMGPGSRVIGP